MRRRSNDDMSMTWPPLAKSSGSVDPVIKKKLKEIKRLKKGRKPAAIKVSPNKAFAKDLEPCKKEPQMDTTTSSEKIESNNRCGHFKTSWTFSSNFVTITAPFFKLYQSNSIGDDHTW